MQVDGGLDSKTIRDAAEAGANVIVAGAVGSFLLAFRHFCRRFGLL